MTSNSPRLEPNRGSVSPAPKRTSRKGKLSGGIIAISSAAIVSVYALGRTNTNVASSQFLVDAPTAVATPIAQPPTAPPAGNVPGDAQVAAAAAPAASATRPPSTATPGATYKDGTYVGSGNSRHGGMDVTIVVQGGQITSADVTSCYTRYPCSAIDPLVSATLSRQGVPPNHVSGASDSSSAYRQAVSSALKQAKS